ncbi:MAG: hypothetical protein QM687_07000 [Ferruginibacter sp.]
MKKLCLLFIVCFAVYNNLQAQFAPLTPPQPVKKTPTVKTQASPGLTATPTRTSTTPQPPTEPEYFLTGVKVNIGTGNDNKESLSNVSVECWVRDTRYVIFAQNNLNNEMKSNSTTSIGLEQSAVYTGGMISSIPIHYITKAAGTQPVKLKDVQTYGLAVRIIYKPNLFTDAWKIENVSLSLEFRDAQRNLHPAMGQKTISFGNAATFLDNFDKRMLICTADQYFNPLTSFVTKDLTKLW